MLNIILTFFPVRCKLKLKKTQITILYYTIFSIHLLYITVPVLYFDVKFHRGRNVLFFYIIQVTNRKKFSTSFHCSLRHIHIVTPCSPLSITLLSVCMDTVMRLSQRFTDVGMHEEPLSLQPEFNCLSTPDSSPWLMQNVRNTLADFSGWWYIWFMLLYYKSHKKENVSGPKCPQAYGFHFDICWNMAGKKNLFNTLILHK